MENATAGKIGKRIGEGRIGKNRNHKSIEKTALGRERKRAFPDVGVGVQNKPGIAFAGSEVNKPVARGGDVVAEIFVSSDFRDEGRGSKAWKEPAVFTITDDDYFCLSSTKVEFEANGSGSRFECGKEELGIGRGVGEESYVVGEGKSGKPNLSVDSWRTTITDEDGIGTKGTRGDW